MDVEKLFNNLESNNPQEYEESKKKLAEFFNLTKDQGLVKDMMEYYYKTNSLRIVEVLTKVQQPHDNFVFDRLSEWIKNYQYRNSALTLFGCIVRKHPTWLHKVSKHKLIKDIFKLLQNEKEIVPLMSALLCIITLLPIIPSSTLQFLPELCDVFGHLASWNCMNPNRLSEYQLIHLQLGLHMLFHRLYGMYPWHFIMYLREFVVKEKGAIFQHTIKPLLETVRVHPILVTSSKETEANASRWKDMEPHDVVVECAKLSVALYNRDNNPDCFASVAALRNQDTPRSLPPQQQSYSSRNTPFEPITGFASPFHSLMQREKLMDYQKFDQIWSPHIEILATPPPTGIIPQTPTPNYGVPMITSSSNLHSILGASGSSPPEAAVEATPETTPLKDVNLKRGPSTAAKPHAVRSILGSSQPSSPMRKEQSPFNYPDNSQLITSVSSTNTTSITGTNQRYMQMVNDRNLSQLRAVNSMESNFTATTNNQKLNLLTMRDNHTTGYKFFGQMSSLDSPTFPSESSKEDQEVTDLTSQQLGIANNNSTSGPHHSDTLQDISNECDEDEAEQSPCSAGGLHVPTNRAMQLYANRIKRNRLPTYCQNDNSSYLSYATSPAEVSANGINIFMIAKAKVRRTNSWPILNKKLSMDGYSLNDYMKRISHNQENIPITTAQQNGDSSSPSCDDVMSAATHFKKIQQKKDRKQAVGGGSTNSTLFKKFDNFCNYAPMALKKGEFSSLTSNSNFGLILNRKSIVPKISCATQTVQQWSTNYEYNLLELFVEDNKQRNFAETPILEPHEILNQYIDRTIKAKYSNELLKGSAEDEFKEQLALVYLQLQYERHRREIHAERNRRLMGRSRDKRSLELENDRLRDILRISEEQNKGLTNELKTIRSLSKENELKLNKELNLWKSKYQIELDANKKLRITNENIQRRLNDEMKSRQQVNYEIDGLRGEIFDLKNELTNVQYQAELGMQYKQDLIKLENEFLVMGEVQIKCRDRLNEIDNLRARDEELKLLQAAYKNEINDIRSTLEEKSTQLDSAKHRLNELQSQLANKEVVFTDQKRLLKSVKDEYEEKFIATNKKYDVQKAIILQMEQKIFELYKNRTAVNLASPESERGADGSSTDRTSPLSTSLASSGDGLSASLRSVTELYNLQAIVNTGGAECSSTSSSFSMRNVTSYATSHNKKQQQQHADRSSKDYSSKFTTLTPNTVPSVSGGGSSSTLGGVPFYATSSTNSSNTDPATNRHHSTAGSLDIPVPGTSQQIHHYSTQHR